MILVGVVTARRARALVVVALAACHGAGPASEPDAAGETDAAPDAAAMETPLALHCAATTATFAPGPCPTPTGTANTASFCFRPGWPGVTAVEVYGGFGRADDWSAPFATLADDGTGTYVATVALANGTYPYMFRVHGAADKLVRDGQYLNDQLASQFVLAPAGAPVKRSISQLTVPQLSATIHHLRGTVTYAGLPQPCFAIALEVGELRAPGGRVIAEHYTGAFAESAADGSFDFPVADGPVIAIIKFPFGLAGTYPDPHATPSVGVIRAAATLAGADVTLDPAPVEYAAADYAAMSPIGTGALPVTFAYSLAAPGADVSVAVIGTSIAGNDPAFWSSYSTSTSYTWDGRFGNGTAATPGTTYYWGTWQHRRGPTTAWVAESLLFPIVF